MLSYYDLCKFVLIHILIQIQHLDFSFQRQLFINPVNHNLLVFIEQTCGQIDYTSYK